MPVKKYNIDLGYLYSALPTKTGASRNCFSLAIARGISNTLNVPADEDTQFYNHFHLKNVQDIVTALNEGYVINTKLILKYVRNFFDLRYDLVHSPMSFKLEKLLDVDNGEHFKDDGILDVAPIFNDVARTVYNSLKYADGE